MSKPNGAQIRRRRQERGLTTAELAARVGFRNEGAMRNIENRNDSTAMIKLYRIARERGVAVDEIIAAEDAEPPTDDEPLLPRGAHRGNGRPSITGMKGPAGPTSSGPGRNWVALAEPQMNGGRENHRRDDDGDQQCEQANKGRRRT